MKEVRMYTIQELCNENEEVIIKSREGIELKIEQLDNKLSLYLYKGGEIIKREFDYVVIPKER